MFERFTPRARRAIVVSETEARALCHEWIRPEHLLLGLAQGDGISARVLGHLGVTPELLRARVSSALGHGAKPGAKTKIPFSPEAKKSLELSLREALALGHNYIGTEHILLGTLRVLEAEGLVASLLGMDADAVRAKVSEMIPGGASLGASPPSEQSPAAAEAARHARALAGSGQVTTAHLLLAILADERSQASRILAGLGVSAEKVESQSAGVPLRETSDAPPRPQAVEIKLGEITTTISDPELAGALEGLSPEELKAALRRALGTGEAG